VVTLVTDRDLREARPTSFDVGEGFVNEFLTRRRHIDLGRRKSTG